MNLFSYFFDHLIIKEKHIISGKEYSKTLDAWLNNMYKNKDKIMEIFKTKYGNNADYIYQSWRMFYLMSSCSFSYNKGNNYCVAYFIMGNK